MSPSSRSPLQAFRPLAGRALEIAINRALALDVDTRDALRPLHGQRLVLRMQSPPLAMQIDVDVDRLRVGPVDEEGEPDLAVRGTLTALVSQLPFMQRNGVPAGSGKVRIEGDAELARRLQHLARGFDPDWQLPFVNVFGEVLGVQIAKTFAAALRQARVAGEDIAQTTAEYLTEETRDVVGRAELQAHLDDVDAIRDDIERLAVRVRRLQARRKPSAGTSGSAG